VIPSGDHGNHLKEFSKNPNKGYYKHALEQDRETSRKVHFNFFLLIFKFHKHNP
jgi:hypothetical protein